MTITHYRHPQVAAIDQQLRDLTDARQAAEGDRARLALAAMTDKAAAKKLDAIEAELAGYAAGIDRATAARRAAVEVAAAEFGQHKADALAANVADALAAAKQRCASAEKIEKAIAVLGVALEQHNAAGILSWSALSKCSGLTGSIEATISLRDSALGLGATVAATQALYFVVERANSLGGAHLAVDFPGLSTVHGGVADGARTDLARIERATAQWTAA